ncbi:hypothetical protein K440DRAFT_623717, partial [Wilcoxina mikolae CBS 423.85]
MSSQFKETVLTILRCPSFTPYPFHRRGLTRRCSQPSNIVPVPSAPTVPSASSVSSRF